MMYKMSFPVLKYIATGLLCSLSFMLFQKIKQLYRNILEKHIKNGACPVYYTEVVKLIYAAGKVTRLIRSSYSNLRQTITY